MGEAGARDTEERKTGAEIAVSITVAWNTKPERNRRKYDDHKDPPHPVRVELYRTIVNFRN